MDGNGAASENRRESRRRARAERRHARWHRPRQPRDWRFFVGGLGRVLIVIGILMFGFVAYQLWGTGLEYAQAQNRLDDELEELFASASAGTSTTTTASDTSTTAGAAPATDAPASTTAPTAPGSTTATMAAGSTTATTAVPVTIPVPPLEEGDAIARIEIPSIGLDAVVVAGVHPSDLKRGPGHYSGTPMPGQLGNSAIVGHRTTYGQPFFDLDDMEPGEEIVLTTVQGRFVYRMTDREVVAPSDGDVVLTTDPTVARLTLTTCDPKYTATNRLIVYADLDAAASGPALPALLPDYDEPALPDGQLPGGSPATTAPAPGATDASAPSSGEPSASDAPATAPTPAADDGAAPTAVEREGAAVDAFSHGWFSDSAAWSHVVAWGLLGASIVVAGWFVARAFERYWVGALVAAVPFVVALYFFYQNVNRLLPAAI